MRHELYHYIIHIIESDVPIKVFIKQAEAEFILFLFCAILINVNNSNKFFKGNMLVSIFINEFEDSITQEWITALTQQTKESPKLLQVH